MQEFYSIFKKFSFNLWENFTQYLREFHSVFMKVLWNFKENFMEVSKQFYMYLYSHMWVVSQISDNKSTNDAQMGIMTQKCLTLIG